MKGLLKKILTFFYIRYVGEPYIPPYEQFSVSVAFDHSTVRTLASKAVERKRLKVDYVNDTSTFPFHFLPNSMGINIKTKKLGWREISLQRNHY